MQYLIKSDLVCLNTAVRHPTVRLGLGVLVCSSQTVAAGGERKGFFAISFSEHDAALQPSPDGERCS
jgi:hypothetical protein